MVSDTFRYVDYINLMAYDFRTPEVGVADVTGEHSGLYASAVDMPSDKNLNSEYWRNGHQSKVSKYSSYFLECFRDCLDKSWSQS